MQRCPACTKAAERKRARDAHAAMGRAVAEARHRAAGRVGTCVGCGLQYCPLYGGPSVRNRAAKWSCEDCRAETARRCKGVARAKRKARMRGVTAESVSPTRVFERDGWRCRLCGISTPRAKRGTTAHDAPELDHIVPLARGGPHTYANTQCACRECNGFKSDRTPEEMSEALAA